MKTATTTMLHPGRILAAYLALPLCLFVVLLPAAAVEGPAIVDDFYLHDGDRVVFYGDSITEQGYYTRAIENYVLTRLPGLKVSFINSGWSGDRAWGGEGGTLEERLERDVIAHRPTVVTVMLGMNDGYYMNFDPKAVAAFKASLKKLVDTLQNALPDVRITLIGASPYDNISPGNQPDWEQDIAGGYNAVVACFSQATREVAQEKELLYVDMNEPLVQLLKQAQETNPELANQLIPDRIHSGPVAGLAMAGCLLAAWNAPINTEVAIDAVQAADGVSRSVQKLALPFPIDREDALTALVIRLSPELQVLLGDKIRVVNSTFPRASLQIDGEQVGTFSAQQLADGVDLAVLETPLSQQAVEVARLTRLRNDLQFTRWRRLKVPFPDGPPTKIKEATEELAAIDNQIVDLQREAARPTPHSFELQLTKQ